MPLVKDSSKTAFNKNLRILLDEDYPIKQALAITYSIQRKYSKKKKPKRKPIRRRRTSKKSKKH